MKIVCGAERIAAANSVTLHSCCLRSCLALLVACSVVGCASISGYPHDPEDTSGTLTKLKPYFDGTKEQEYLSAATEADKQKKRDEIVLARIRAYDIEFGEFEQEMFGQGNMLATGGDLIALVLAGLTATTGNASTKAALGAASAGVVGAQATINKDLYYQRTIPALLAQMEANRAKAKLTIVKSLAQPNSQYSLMQAFIDLDVYKSAGSLVGAVTSITQDAGSAKEKAQSDIQITRSASYIAQLPDVQSVQALVKKLTPAQLINLAKAMQPNLAARPAEIQRLVSGLDPNGKWLNDGDAAKKVILDWLGEEDMTPANKKQWTDAIAKASQ
jgi:hypothetical protein